LAAALQISKRFPTPSKESYEVYKAYKSSVRQKEEIKKVPAYMRSVFKEKAKLKGETEDPHYVTNGSSFSINPELPTNQGTKIQTTKDILKTLSA